MPLASKNLLAARQAYLRPYTGLDYEMAKSAYRETTDIYIKALECELEAQGVKLELPLEPEDNKPFVTVGILIHGFYAEHREYVNGEYRVTKSVHLKANNKEDAIELAKKNAQSLGWEYR